ncbi:MAG: SRPBCC family protein [Bacteroidota bacterium]|nr:SRPBCC family protein [Bacteroidota bacterium]
MKNEITIKYSVRVAKPREFVWDYTQDYSHRTEWDSSVLEAHVVQNEPNRIVTLRTKGRTSMMFVYKLDDKPNRTTLVAREIESPLIESAGGSWQYVDDDGGTLWTQSASIRFKKNFFLPILLPLYRMMFQAQTQGAMKKAKAIMER